MRMEVNGRNRRKCIIGVWLGWSFKVGGWVLIRRDDRFIPMSVRGMTYLCIKIDLIDRKSVV